MAMDPKIKAKLLEALSDDPEEETTETSPVTFDELKYLCLHCAHEFPRKHANETVKKCPACKSERIVDQKERITDKQKESRYSPSIEFAILGPSDKFFVANQIKAKRRGKR